MVHWPTILFVVVASTVVSCNDRFVVPWWILSSVGPGHNKPCFGAPAQTLFHPPNPTTVDAHSVPVERSLQPQQFSSNRQITIEKLPINSTL